MFRHPSIPLLLLLCLCLISVVAGCGGGTSSPSTRATATVTHPSSTQSQPAVSIGTISAMISGLQPLAHTADGYSIAADDTAVWVYNGETGILTRIDPKTNTLVATLSVGQGCTPSSFAYSYNCGNVAIGQGAVWVSIEAAATIKRVDPATNQVVATIALDPKALPLVSVTPGAVWAANESTDTVSQIDPQTNRVVATLPNQPGASDVAFGAGSLWVCDFNTTQLVRLDPTTLQVQAQIEIPGSCARVIALDQAVWVLTETGPLTIARIDPAINQVSATYPFGVAPQVWMAADAQGAWVISTITLLTRLDPQSGQPRGQLSMRGDGLALGAGSVWVPLATGTLLRITPAS
jgi:streptogramin lyase